MRWAPTGSVAIIPLTMFGSVQGDIPIVALWRRALRKLSLSQIMKTFMICVLSLIGLVCRTVALGNEGGGSFVMIDSVCVGQVLSGPHLRMQTSARSGVRSGAPIQGVIGNNTEKMHVVEMDRIDLVGFGSNGTIVFQLNDWAVLPRSFSSRPSSVMIDDYDFPIEVFGGKFASLSVQRLFGPPMGWSEYVALCDEYLPYALSCGASTTGVNWIESLYVTCYASSRMRKRLLILTLLLACYSLSTILRALWTCVLKCIVFLCLAGYYFVSLLYARRRAISHISLLYGGLWIMSKGLSIVPLGLVLALILGVDFRSYSFMSYDEDPLDKYRRFVLACLQCKTRSRVDNLYFAYKSICEPLGLPKLVIKKTKHYLSPDCYFGNETTGYFSNQLESVFEKKLLEKLDKTFVLTAGEIRWGEHPTKWNFILPIVEACGGNLPFKDTLMIQDCLLFVGKMIYMVTDTRAVKYAAIAAEIASFRNTACGVAMSHEGFKFFEDVATQLFNPKDFVASQPTRQFKTVDRSDPDYRFTSFSFSELTGLLGSLDSGLRSLALRRMIQLIAIVVALVSFCGKEKFNFEGMTRVVKAIKSQPFDDSLDIASQLLSLLKWLAETGWHLFSFPGDLGSTLSGPALWKQKAEDLLAVKGHANFQNAIGTGAVDTEGNKVPLSVFRTRLLNLIKPEWRVVESALRVSGSRFIMSEFKALHQRLVTFESELQAQILTQSYRKAPFGVALVGGTAVGKSTITSLIFAYYSSLRGVSHLPEMIFSHPSFTEFWDTFYGQDYILFDDVGAIHPQSKSEDKSLFDVLNVVNNAPYVVPMAQADQKGTQCVTSKMVIATSNQDDLGARNLFACPEAVLRRFNIFVAMQVKPAFATNNRIDPVKIAKFWQDEEQRMRNGGEKRPYSERIPPFWNFYILELGADGLTGDHVRRFEEPYSATMDLLDYIFTNVEIHDTNQERVFNSFKTLKTFSMCEPCKKPFDICGCPHVDFQLTMRQGEDSVAVDEDLGSFSSIAVLIAYYLLCGLFGCSLLWLAREPILYFLYNAVYLAWSSFLSNLYFLVSLVCIFIVSCQILHSFVSDEARLVNARSRLFAPAFLVSSIGTRLGTACQEYGLFTRILLVGRFSETAWRKACLALMEFRIKRIFTRRNATILALIACFSAVIMGPLYMTFFTKKWSLTSGDSKFDFESKIRPAPVEDSRSVYYNPNPPQYTMSDKSKCLSGSSADPWVENKLRKNTCNINFFGPGDENLGSVLGLAIGGNLVATVAHAAAERTTPFMASNRLAAFSGELVFTGTTGMKIKHKFLINTSTSYIDVSNDFLLLDIPSMPSRDSLVDYFLETNDALKEDYKCRFVEPTGWELVSQMTKYSIRHNPKFDPHFLTTAMSVVSARGRGPGHSGATLVAQSVTGTAILGFQSMEGGGQILSSFIGRSYLKNAIRSITSSSEGTFSFVPKGNVVGENSQYVPLDGEPSPGNPLLHGFEPCLQANMTFEGKLKSACGHGSSAVGDPPYKDFFFTRGYESTKEVPIFDWKSKRHYLEQVGKISHKIDSKVLSIAKLALLNHWKTAYSEKKELSLLAPLNLKEAINGRDDITWVEKLKYDTSAGFPWNKAKLQLLEQRASTEYACGYEYYLPPKLNNDYSNYFASLLNGNPFNYPYKGSQKDEPISADKNRTRGPRIFCAANMFVVLAGRMLFGSYIRMAQRNFFISWAAVGMNASSKIWGLLWLWISSFGINRIIAGDYTNYDQNMSPLFTRAAYFIIIGLLEASGNYDPPLIEAAKSWAAEAINPTVIFDSDIFTVAGTNPSGNPLTVHVNCIVNILFIMYVWIRVGNDVHLFFIQVKMMTYGDDNLISVSIMVVNFNYWVIHSELKTIGVSYTPADKSDAKEKDFDDPKDLAFLKRGFLFRLGFWYAPLDLSSFSKTFTSWRKNGQEAQLHGMDCLRSCWENSVHLSPDTDGGRIRKDIKDACAHLSWPSEGFKSVEEIDKGFREAAVDRWDALKEQSGLPIALLQTLGAYYNPECYQIFSVFWYALLAPFWEEPCKALMKWLLYGIAWIAKMECGFIVPLHWYKITLVVWSAVFALEEWYHKIMAFGFSWSAIPAIGMHIACAFISNFWLRCLFHLSFNVLAIWINANAQGRCVVFPGMRCCPKYLTSIYNGNWSEIFEDYGFYYGFHGIAHVAQWPDATGAYHSFQSWYSACDSAYVQLWRNWDLSQPHGAGFLPLIPATETAGDDWDHSLGAYDYFSVVYGPGDYEDWEPEYYRSGRAPVGGPE